jgi:hypothetical protein
VRELALPADTGILSAQGIDDDGTVVGTGVGATVSPLREPNSGPDGTGTSVDSLTTATRGLVWAADGTVRELTAPSGYGPETSAQSIQTGWVVGRYQDSKETSPSAMIPARWNLKTGEVRPVRLPSVVGVNRYGWVTGIVQEASGLQSPVIAFDDRNLVLPKPQLYEGSKGGSATVTISDDGREIGGTLRQVKRAEDTAFRWTCT